MKYYLKQRFFSWFDSYNIYDESGKIAFIAKGELAWGHQLKIYDGNYRLLGIIKEKMFTFLPKFIMYNKNGIQIGKICKKITFFTPQYYLTCNDWNIVGDIMKWNYKVIDSRRNLIMTTSKKLFNITDTYEINVNNIEDSLLAIMIVLSIDIDKCRQSKENNWN